MSKPGDVVWAGGKSWHREASPALRRKAWWVRPGGSAECATLKELKQYDDFAWLVYNDHLTPVGEKRHPKRHIPRVGGPTTTPLAAFTAAVNSRDEALVQLKVPPTESEELEEHSAKKQHTHLAPAFNGCEKCVQEERDSVVAFLRQDHGGEDLNYFADVLADSIEDGEHHLGWDESFHHCEHCSAHCGDTLYAPWAILEFDHLGVGDVSGWADGGCPVCAQQRRVATEQGVAENYFAGSGAKPLRA